VKPFDELVGSLREEADLYVVVGAAVDGAKLCHRIAEQIETAQREWLWETLSVTQAADESGRSYTTIWRKLKKGILPNVGTDQHPKVRRVDLYRDGRAPGPDLAGKILRESA
jgi:hypothetical protein